MKIGIIETGLLRDDLLPRFPSYPEMFIHLLERADPGFDFDTASVVNGEPLPPIDSCDGWLITGSRHGAYDGLDWFGPLERFVRDLVDARRPLIGVCFGHQIMARALGGDVVKSARGWGVGVHTYRVDRRHGWMDDGADRIDIYAFHQDQVVALPPTAEIFLSSNFCPYAGLAYGASAISFQGHPEIAEDYETALLESLRGKVIPEAIAEGALAVMRAGATPDTERTARWFARFYRQAPR